MPRVLVIDDDPTLRRMLSKGLTMAGYQVREAEDGLLGVEALQKEPADLVLCDLYMPRLDGVQTILELRRSWPRTPVIAMSGGPPAATSHHDFLALAPRLGASAVLQKPFGVRDAVRLAEMALAGDRVDDMR